MLTIDGSQGEGGGQILRTALALSLVTGQPVRMERIRAKRQKPGLLKQHLTAVEAAKTVGCAEVEGAVLGSQTLEFKPGPVTPGNYRFAVGTAGSATLVLQTVLPALLTASGHSTLTLEGGDAIYAWLRLVRAASSTPVIDLQALLDAVIFNWLIGNNDAHGKNFSLVYRGEISSGLQTRLSPLYDLISTVYYPELSPKMAMKIGGEYLSERIAPAHFERLAEEAGLAKPMMKRRVLELAEALLSKLPAVTTDDSATVAVAEVIQSRCERKIISFKA